MSKNFIILLSVVALIIAGVLILSSQRQKNEVGNEVGQNEITLLGTLEYLELEGGCYKFNSDDGSSYELYGIDENKIKDLVGKKFLVKGSVNQDMVSICQIGPIFEVKSLEVL